MTPTDFLCRLILIAMLPLFLAIVSLVSLTVCADHMETQLNPGCTICSADDQLVYARSTTANESYHFVWSSLSQDDPTFLLVHSSSHQNVSIDWGRLMAGSPDSLTVADVVNDIGIVMKNVLFWNDTQKAGTFNHSDPRTAKDLKSLQKSNVTIRRDDESGSEAVFLFTESETSNLTVRIAVFAATGQSRFEELPRLLMSPTSFHVQVTIDGDPLLNYTNCRLLLDVELLHRKGDISVVTETTIDDEFSPGVFSVSTAKVDTSPKSFVQWKPVGYNKADRIIAHTVDTKVSIDKRNWTSSSKVVNGYSSRSDLEISSLRIAFGAAKDSFYTEYTGFSFVVGLGTPEKDGLSFLVQLIIWIGFGVPVLALIAGASYLTVKRIRSRSSRHLLQD